jgi:hypothetical protein
MRLLFLITILRPGNWDQYQAPEPVSRWVLIQGQWLFPKHLNESKKNVCKKRFLYFLASLDYANTLYKSEMFICSTL